MVIGSVLTSIPFALLHVDQQGHALDIVVRPELAR